MAWLYRYEAKSIQSWILGTDRLIELKGGSTLIQRLDEHAAASAEPSAFLYAAAGAGTARFSSKEALERFARWWPVWVSRYAPGLELVQAWVEGDDLTTLRERLGAQRNAPPAALPEAGPWVARAGRSGLPAVSRDGTKGGLLDAGTRARVRATRSDDALGDLLSEGLEDFTFETDLQRYPEDEGVALVHADGNGIGQVIHGMSTDQLEAFSHELRRAAIEAGRSAVAGLFDFERRDADVRRSGELVLRGRPIVAGGDDFTFLVRGRAGIALAHRWITTFESATRRLGMNQGAGLTACAGVVLVRRGFPFRQQHALAEHLCDTAKRRFRSAPEEGSRMAFTRVTTSLGEASAPSWSIQDLERLADLVRKAASLPRGKLHQWSAEPDPARRAAFWDRLKEVAEQDDAGRWSAFEESLGALGDRTVAAIRGALEWSRVAPPHSDLLWRDE